MNDTFSLDQISIAGNLDVKKISRHYKLQNKCNGSICGAQI